MFKNYIFNIRYNTDENKVYISCNFNIKVQIELYDNQNLLYSVDSHFNNNEIWYSTNKRLNDINILNVKIKQNNIIIREESYILKNHNNQKIKKQIVVSHSKVGIGDNLSATPIIKKLNEIHKQKIILLTYIPIAFKNNPYIEEIIKINDNNHLNKILSFYDTNDYNINNIFNIMNINWRMIDHKQLCAYNVGFQLKQHELDMEFYPDEYENIENLPEKFICINPSETEPERTWGYKNWQKLINLIQEHIPVVAIGKETYLDKNLTKRYSNIEIKNGLNLLNHPSQNSLSQAYHIINKSETFVTMNNGLYILALCNLDNHITELSTSWNTYFYRMRKGIENYNLSYIRGSCKAECLANPELNVDIIGSTNILKSGTCYLNKPTYECHPTPEQVYESILKKLNI